MINKPKIFFPNLDGIRFLSFFLVLLAHSGGSASNIVKDSFLYTIFKKQLFYDGELGVSIFFVLSGFLISYLLLKEKEYTGKVHLLSFYIRRFLRIWPLYYFVVFFGFFIYPSIKNLLGQPSVETANIYMCSFFLNNIDKIYHKPDAQILNVLWSVAVEEQFYIIWPLFFMFFKNKYLKYIILSLIIFSTIYRFVYFKYGHIDLHTFGVITDLAIGGLGALIICNSQKFENFIRNLSKPTIAIPYIIFFIFLIFRKNLYTNDTLFILKRLILSTAFIFIILEQNFSTKSFFKFENYKFITFWGKYTYGLYCLHLIVCIFSTILFSKIANLNPNLHIWIIEIIFSLVGSMIISYFSYHYFENWFLKQKERFSFITK